jgi:hypothetical protein
MTDLDKLIAAVEAGTLRQDDHLWLHMPYALDEHRNMRTSVRNAQDAYHGSLDAAKRLHDALLPGMFWNMGHLDMPSLGYVCTVAEGHFADSPSWRGYAMNPARAWLLAILRAIKAKGDAE